MIHDEVPQSLPKVWVRLGAETYTFRPDALGGYDALIVERKISADIG